MDEEKTKYQKLTEEADTLQNEYTSRQFSYDPEADAGYKEYARLMRESGKKAMEDTIGKASALTGGYGNSWAASVGQQAYGDYMKQTADAQLTFRQQARDEFDAQNQDILNRLGIVNNQRAAMYTPPSADQIAYAKEIYKSGGEDALNAYTGQLADVDTDAIYEAIVADTELQKQGAGLKERFTMSDSGGFNGGGGLNRNAKYTLDAGKDDVKTMTASEWVAHLSDKDNDYGMDEEQAREFMLELQKAYGQ